MKGGNNKFLLYMAVIILFVFACSHPEEDAIIAAMKYNKCQEEFLDKLQKDKNLFVNDFDARKYKNRESAEKELQDILFENIPKYEQQILSVQKIREEYGKRYMRNTRKKFQYNNSYLMALDNVDFNPQEAIEDLLESESVVVCLRQLPPSRPKIKQICSDLQQHELVERGENCYFDKNWRLIIKEDCVEKLEITDSTRSGDRWKYSVKMCIKEGGHYFNAKAEIIYAMNESKVNWELTDVISQELSIMKTQMYRSSIPVPKVDVVNDYWGNPKYSDVTLTSTCDSPLLVGGQKWVDENIGWKTFVLSLRALGTTTIRCGYRPNGQQVIKIDFVEKL